MGGAGGASAYPLFGAVHLPVSSSSSSSSGSSISSTPFSFKPQTLNFGNPAATPSASNSTFHSLPAFASATHAAAPPAPTEPTAGEGEGRGEEEDAMPLLAPDKAVKQGKDPNEVFEKDPVRVYRLDKENKTWVDMGKGSLGTSWCLHSLILTCF